MMATRKTSKTSKTSKTTRTGETGRTGRTTKTSKTSKGGKTSRTSKHARTRVFASLRRRSAEGRAGVTVARRAAPGPLRGAAPAPSSVDLDHRLADLQKSIDILLEAVERLEAIPADEVAQLALDDRKARVHAMSDAFLAIEDLENAKLRALNAEFESRRVELHQATNGLANDLSQLQDTVAFIAAAASAVGIVADVVSLIA